MTDTQAKQTNDFESKISKLQSIVEKLENDASVTLEDSMSLFEQGLALTGECVNDLNEMQARIAALNNKLDTILGRAGDGEKNDY